MGNVSNPVTSTILPTVSEVSTTGGPTEQSTPTSSSSSPGETSAISHMAQTTRNITTRGSETFTSVSQVTDTFSTVTSPPPSPPTNGHTFPQTMATTTSPSGTSTTFLSSSVTNGHTSQTGKETSSVGETAGPTTVISTTLSDVTSSSPPKNLSTSGEVLATSSSSDFHKNITTAILMPTGGPRNDSKKPTQASTSSVGISNTSTHEPSATVETLTSTSNPTTRTNFVSSTNTPSSAAGSTLTVSQEPVSHPSLGTTSATSSETTTPQPTSSYTSAHMPTSPVAPTSNTNKATELGSTTTTPVVTRGNPVAISDAATNNTTSDGSTTEGPTRQSTPISIRTSVQQSSAVSQIGHTLGSHSTQESQITGSVSPMTDNINTVTSPTPSFKLSGPSPSGTFPQDTSATSGGTTFTISQPTDIMNKTQVTGGLLATPTSPDTTLGASTDTAHSIASTTPQVTSLFSTSGGPAGQSAGPSTTTSPDATSAFFQTHQTQSIETTGQPDTSKPASSVTHTTLEGTTTSSSSTANSPTASGSASPETATPGKVTIFSAAPSINSHITQSTTDSLSTVPSLVTTPEIMGNVSNPVTSTILPTVSEVSTTGGPTEQSTPTSSSSSPGETSAISHMAQTTRNITTRGSETFTSVSQVTDTISTVTSPPPSPPTNGHTFPQTMATTTSPSGTSTTFLSSSVTNGHTSQTGKETSSVGETAGPTTVISTTLSDVTSSSPPKNLSTSGEVLATSSSSDFHKNITTAILMPTGGPRNDSKKPTQASTSSVGISNTSTHEPSATVETLTSTSNPTTRTNFVSSTNTPSSAAGSTLTVSQEPVSHPSLGTTSATSSETTTPQPTSSYTSAHMPTSPVAPTSNTNKATELGSTTTTPVVTRGNPVAISDAATNNTTSDGSTTEGPTRQSTPISIRTSVQQSSAVSQIGHTLGSHSTQESQITGSVSPMTDNINTVTSPTPSFKLSGPSPSGTFPQDTSATSGGTTFTISQPTDIMNKTQVTGGLLATPTSPDTTLGASTDTAHSIASTTPQVTSLFSTSGGPAGQSAGPSTTTSPDATSAFFQTHQTQSIETTGQPDTSKPASSVTHTTLEGTTTSSSSTANSPTASGSASPETATPGKVTIFSAAPSINSHITQSTTDSLSTVPSLVTTPEIMGNVSNPVTSTILPTVSEVSTTGGPTEQSTPTSSSSSPGETSAISHMAQTTRNITTRGSETFTSVSQVTDTISTVTSPPPSPTSNGHRSPQTIAPTLLPSDTSTTFFPTPVSNGHTIQTSIQALWSSQ
ncbi:mucin-4-like [Loxodonta africana]|uniref:mucin-4-like n=1 Tax=Loxodonta africana TaxID=9785 RepID=UPI0030CF7BE5